MFQVLSVPLADLCSIVSADSGTFDPFFFFFLRLPNVWHSSAVVDDHISGGVLF